MGFSVKKILLNVLIKIQKCLNSSFRWDKGQTYDKNETDYLESIKQVQMSSITVTI